MIQLAWRKTFPRIQFPAVSITSKTTTTSKNKNEYDPVTERVVPLDEYERHERASELYTANHVYIQTTKHTILKQKGQFVDKLNLILSKKSCTRSSYLSQNFLAAFAVSNPQIAPRNIQLLIAIARFTLLYDVNELCVKKNDFVTIQNVYNCSPKASTIDNWILNLAARQIVIARAAIVDDVKIFLQTDGGHNGQEVRLLSYYNKASDKIEVIWLGLTYCGKASNLVAEGLKLSLDLWFGEGTMIAGTTGDSGAGTPESLGRACQEVGIATNSSSDHSCGLHDITSVFRPTVQKVIGEGGLDRENAIQMLHTLYALHFELGPSWPLLLKRCYFAMTGSNVIPEGLLAAIQEPLQTRWWTIAVLSDSTRLFLRFYLAR
jgi:hypothetical protein